MSNLTILSALGAAIIAIIYGIILILAINKKPSGSKKMVDIAKAIADGAKTYLNRQYKTLALVAVIIFTILLYLLGWKIAVGFLSGAALSAIAGYIGMNVSVRANVRTAEAAKSGIASALSVSSKAGLVTGLLVIGLGLLAVVVFYLIFADTTSLIGLGFGASLISIFARLGGGIYTKGADIGADLSGKIEAGVPEDDPRNPAVIADNVGDNVGDCAGMAADLFETYIVALIAAMLIGSYYFGDFQNAVLYPLVIAAAAILCTIIGSWFVRLGKRSGNIMMALYKNLFVSGILSLLALYFITQFLMKNNEHYLPLHLYYTTIIGVVITLLMMMVTQYYTSKSFSPVRTIALGSATSTSTNIINGLAIAMKSTILPAVFIAGGIILAYHFAGVYGIAITVTTMLALAGVIVAIDAFGPVVDNAGGIAKMAELPEEVRKNTDALDAVGNTTKAVTKGYAIASAGLSAIILFSFYIEELAKSGKALHFELSDPYVIAGLLIGGILPYYFGSAALQAVGRAGSAVVAEVRRQFSQIFGLREGRTQPDYKKCVDIVTQSALAEMVVPTLVIVLLPIIVGFVLGPTTLGGMLVGIIIVGIFVAISMTNGGGAWDNAKKYIEESQGHGKGSEAHWAAVIGDTVGDPYKDTAGPAINPMIKVTNIIALLIVPFIANPYSLKIRLIIVACAFVVFLAYVLLRRSYKIPARSCYSVAGGKEYRARKPASPVSPSVSAGQSPDGNQGGPTGGKTRTNG